MDLREIARGVLVIASDPSKKYPEGTAFGLDFSSWHLYFYCTEKVLYALNVCPATASFELAVLHTHLASECIYTFFSPSRITFQTSARNDGGD